MSKAPREQFSAYGSSNYPGSKFSFRRTNSTAGLVESKAFRKRFSAYGSSNYPGSSFRRTAGVQSIPEEVFGVREFKLSWNSFRHTDRHLWSPKYSESGFRRTEAILEVSSPYRQSPKPPESCFRLTGVSCRSKFSRLRRDSQNPKNIDLVRRNPVRAKSQALQH